MGLLSRLEAPTGLEEVAPVGVIVGLRNVVLFIGQRFVIWKKNIENVWQGARKTYVLLSEFLSFMLSTPLLSSVMD